MVNEERWIGGHLFVEDAPKDGDVSGALACSHQGCGFRVVRDATVPAGTVLVAAKEPATARVHPTNGASHESLLSLPKGEWMKIGRCPIGGRIEDERIVRDAHDHKTR